MVLLPEKISPYRKDSIKATRKVLPWVANLANCVVLQGWLCLQWLYYSFMIIDFENSYRNVVRCLYIIRRYRKMY
jgi:hypothetical protein